MIKLFHSLLGVNFRKANRSKPKINSAFSLSTFCKSFQAPVIEQIRAEVRQLHSAKESLSGEESSPNVSVDEIKKEPFDESSPADAETLDKTSSDVWSVAVQATATNNDSSPGSAVSAENERSDVDETKSADDSNRKETPKGENLILFKVEYNKSVGQEKLMGDYLLCILIVGLMKLPK